MSIIPRGAEPPKLSPALGSASTHAFKYAAMVLLALVSMNNVATALAATSSINGAQWVGERERLDNPATL
jgi:hypothetical protein